MLLFFFDCSKIAVAIVLQETMQHLAVATISILQINSFRPNQSPQRDTIVKDSL